MAFKITVRQTKVEKFTQRDHWVQLAETGGTDGKAKYGYAPPHETVRETDLEIYEQRVDHLDMKQLVSVVNGLNSETQVNLIEREQFSDIVRSGIAVYDSDGGIRARRDHPADGDCGICGYLDKLTSEALQLYLDTIETHREYAQKRLAEILAAKSAEPRRTFFVNVPESENAV